MKIGSSHVAGENHKVFSICSDDVHTGLRKQRPNRSTIV